MSTWARLWPSAVYLALVGALLAVTAAYDYTVFHTLIELFSIVVAASVAIITWNARRFLDNGFLALIGMSFLLFAVVETAQLVTFPDLVTLPGSDALLSARIFFVGRFVLAGSFLIAPTFLRRRLPTAVAATVYAALGALSLLVLFVWPLDRVAMVLGVAPAALAIVSGAAVFVAFVAAARRLWTRRERFSPEVAALLVAAILSFAASDAFFVTYGARPGPSNLLGHFMQGLAFFLTYKAVVETAYLRPYSVLYKEIVDQERAVRESEERYRDVAETLQTGLLHVPERLHGVRVLHEYRSSSETARIGGDFYDVFELDRCRVGFVLGDVSGKGVTAATTTAQVKSTIRAYAYIDTDPAFVLAQTNRVLLRLLAEGQFVTAVYGVVDMTRGRLCLASAGHELPVLCRIERCEMLQLPPNLPLGIVEDAVFETLERAVGPDEGLVLYTDGLTDARHDDELFGRERVRDIVEHVTDANPRRVADELVGAALAFAEGRLADDLAVLGLELATDPTAEEAVCRR